MPDRRVTHEATSAETEILCQARRLIATEGQLEKELIPLASHGMLAWAYRILADWHESQRLSDPSLR